MIDKLIRVQSELNAPKGQFNKFGNYKYRSAEDILESVKPLLKENNLSLTISDDVVMIGERIYIKATATVKDTEGNQESVTAFAREAEVKKGMDDSQITGSASSYARKYALNGMFCIDDTKDSNATNKHEKKAGKEDIATIRELLKQTDTQENAVCKGYKVSKLEDLDANQAYQAINGLKKRVK